MEMCGLCNLVELAELGSVINKATLLFFIIYLNCHTKYGLDKFLKYKKKIIAVSIS